MDLIAADGMPVRVLPLDPDALMGAATGHLAPRTAYAVHFHYALEQLTFVLRGRVVVVAGGKARTLGVGEAMTNPPGVTLSFANESDEPAEVLFVCAPPFPTEGTEEVGLPDEHRPLTEAERARSGQRAVWAMEHFRQRLGVESP